MSRMVSSSNLLVLIALLLLCACSSSGGGFQLSLTEQAMVDRHNATRSGAGLGALVVNETLCRIAQQQADYMASTLTIQHEDSGGGNVASRAASRGYVYTAIGENIGRNTSPQELYDGWLGSPGHFANITHLLFTEIGVGMTEIVGQQYWCVTFGDR